MDLIKASKGFVFNKPIRFWAKSVLSGLSPHEKKRLRLASWQYLVPRKRTNILLGCSQTSHLLSSFHWSGGDGHRGIREEYVCGAKEDGSLPSALWMAQEAVHWCCPWHGWHLLHAYAGKRVKEPQWLHWLVVGVVMWSVMIPFLFLLRFSVYGLTAITIFIYLREKTNLKISTCITSYWLSCVEGGDVRRSSITCSKDAGKTGIVRLTLIFLFL